MVDRGDLVADRYRVLDRLGGGAMSEVWRGHDTVLDRDVAMKELLVHRGMTAAQTQEAKDRALREGRIAARLHHPHAIGVYDVVEHAGRPCLIMEFLSARTLAELIAEQGALPTEQVRQIGVQIAGALAAAHAAGIVHRDVKPGNVLITTDGMAKLTDFGISRAVGDVTVTATGILAGTPAYLAPEVAQGHEATQSSDVFSLGATLYCAIEGAPPFGLDSNPIALLHRIATGEVSSPPHAEWLTDPLLRLLRTDPRARPTAREGEHALADVEPAPVPAVVRPPSRAPSHRRKRAVVASMALAVLLVTGILVTIMTKTGTDTGSNPVAAPPSPSQPHSTPSVPPPTTTVEHTTTPAPPSLSTSAPSTTTQALPDQLTSAIVDYYRLVPGNLSVAWTRMTTDYQQNHAGGMSGYQRFWQPIARVSPTDVTASPPNSVTATINYFYRSGNVVAERTRFGLVRQDGNWKIASSTVLSHSGTVA